MLPVLLVLFGHFSAGALVGPCRCAEGGDTSEGAQQLLILPRRQHRAHGHDNGGRQRQGIGTPEASSQIASSISPWPWPTNGGKGLALPMPASSRCPVLVPGVLWQARAGQGRARAASRPLLTSAYRSPATGLPCPRRTKKKHALPPLSAKTNTHSSRCHFHAFSCISLSHLHLQCTALHCTPLHRTVPHRSQSAVRCTPATQTMSVLNFSGTRRSCSCSCTPTVPVACWGGDYRHDLHLPAARPPASPSTATLCASLQLRYPSLNHAHAFTPAVRAFPAPASGPPSPKTTTVARRPKRLRIAGACFFVCPGFRFFGGPQLTHCQRQYEACNYGLHSYLQGTPTVTPTSIFASLAAFRHAYEAHDPIPLCIHPPKHCSRVWPLATSLNLLSLLPLTPTTKPNRWGRGQCMTTSHSSPSTDHFQPSPRLHQGWHYLGHTTTPVNA
ncbi:hypothetical protein COCVIDRAFT_18330 [Bipolaris victoriae FI3]|uniref:Secreted protein n=1 Tax=Bipolaris victoriae (strain FI3) TaxID=930091 RepID=W7EB68_BIPV3|nr:hypothetical protein COCVIDRAFT_18330 [Bipolaris victoriae FI3]